MRDYIKRLFNKYVFPTLESSCLLWIGGRDKDGYGKIVVHRKTKRAHRVLFELEKGSIPKGMCVCHTCDNPSCVNIEHLFLGTHQDNATDRVNKGRSQKGESHSRLKLTEKDIIAIRTDNRRQKIIALEYGVSQVMISRIKLNQAWKHV